MSDNGYNRKRAVQYAHKWAYSRNPKFANFEGDGGDCTNFASQVLYAGSSVMNPSDWYYINVNRRSPSWTSVTLLYRFLVNNLGLGPYAEEVDARRILPGDLIQLRFREDERFRHTPVVVEVGEPGNLSEILVAAHSFNSDDRKLTSYTYVEARFLHILGARK